MSGNPPTGISPTSTSNAPQFAHVLLLVEENQSFAGVVDSSSMPYFNHLISSYGLATQYFANAHPSLPNYFVLTTGDTISLDDNFAAAVTQDSVVRALKNAGKSWKSYAEGLPSIGYLGGDLGAYVKHHNPFAYFADVLNDPAETANIVPFTEFPADLSGGSLPDYAFIVPDIDDDSHDCPSGLSNCSNAQKIAAADNWLKSNIDPLLQSAAFQNSLLIITFDEGDASDNAHGGGQIATLIVSPKSKAGYRSTNFYQHESVLRLSMETLGVTDLPGNAASAPDMDEFFK